MTESGSYTRCRCVEISIIKGYWENYGINPGEIKSIEQYEAYNKIGISVKQKAVNYINFYNEICKKENNWFGVFGQPGSGKSHIVNAIGAALLERKEQPVRVVYMPYLEVMRELKANAMDDEYYTKLINRYLRGEVLIIDDLFKDKVKNGKVAFDLSEADIKHVCPIINHRYLNKAPTLISTECTPNMLLDLDEAIGGRIFERCDNNITIFIGSEFNYRMKNLRRDR